MGIGQGTELIAAFSKGTTWQTAVSVNVANKGFFCNDVAIPFAGPAIHMDRSLGTGFPVNADHGNIDASGTLPCDLRYDGQVLALLAHVFGTAGAPTQEGATTAYTHTFTLKKNLDGIFGTLAVHKGVSIWEMPSVKVHGFTLTCDAGAQAAIITYDMIIDQVKVTGQTNTTLASVTYVTRSLRNIFFHMKLRLNDASGGALGSGDEQKIGSFTLSLRRPVEGVHVADRTRLITEPVLSDLPEGTLQITYPKYESDAQFTRWLNTTDAKGDIDFSHPTQNAGTGFPYKLLWEMPRLMVQTADAPTRGPGRMEKTVTFNLMEAETAPTGMAVTQMIRAKITNKSTGDYLLA